MTIGSLLRDGLRRVRGRYPDLSEGTVYRWLAEMLARAVNASVPWVLAHPGTEVTPSAHAIFKRMVDDWVRGVPLQHILGTWGFWDLDELETPPGVFIPRPETETLLEALRTLFPNPDWSGRIADAGTGTGAIAIAVARMYPRCQVWAVDRSWVAVCVARRNAVRWGVISRVFIWCGDWFQATPPRPLWDAVLANPPYLTRRAWRRTPPEVRIHEPMEALCDPRGPANVYRTLARQVRRRLRPGGVFIVEVDAPRVAHVQRWLQATGGESVGVWRDAWGRPRCVGWRWTKGVR